VVAKYCDEHGCVSVCLSVYVCLSVRHDISRTRCAIFTSFSAYVDYGRGLSSSRTVTKSQGEGAVLGVFFPIDKALNSIAFGTHTKMAEPIDMLFGTMGGLCLTNNMIRGLIISKGKGNFEGKRA